MNEDASRFETVTKIDVGQTPTDRGVSTRSPQTSLRNFLVALAETSNTDGPDSSTLCRRLADVIRLDAALLAAGWFETTAADNESSFAHYLPLAESQLETLLSEAATASLDRNETIAVNSNFSRPTTADHAGAELPQSETAQVVLVAAPVVDSRDPSRRASFTAVFQSSDTSPEFLRLIVESAAAAVQVYRTDERQFVQETELAAAAAIIELCRRIESTETLDEACRLLVDDTSRFIGVPVVAVALQSGSHGLCNLTAVSDTKLKTDPAIVGAFEAACDEVLIREETTIWPAQSASSRHALRTHQQLQQALDSAAVLGCPITTSDGHTLGAWIFSGNDDLIGNAAHRHFVEAASPRIGSALHLIRKTDRPKWRRSLDAVFARATVSRRRTVLAVSAAVLAVMLLPLSWSVESRVELQPVLRRFVAAPFAGTLEKAFVTPGDTVQPGARLARMDEREIDWELAGLDAEHHQASRERDSHLVQQDIGAAEISRYDMERLELRRKLLSHRAEHLEIVSPIAGLVISGDLKKSEGVPLGEGDRLFEIAPLDRMLVEISIPEADIRHTRIGQHVGIVLEAFPGQTWTGTLSRIHPRSEIRDDEHVFIGEVELENSSGRLRPGMQGYADIEAGRRPLGWILFHRPIEALLLSMGW